MISVDLVQILAHYWLKPVLCFAFVLVIMQRATFRSAAVNHRYLLCAIAAIVCLTLMLSLLPHWSLSILPESFVQAARLSVRVGEYSRDIAILYVMLGLYSLGVCWGLVYTLQCVSDAQQITVQSRSLNKTEKKGLVRALQKIEIHIKTGNRRPHIKISHQLQTPLVWKWKAPILLLPSCYETWTADRLERVLAHELAHIERNDWLVKMVIRFVCVVAWPIPFVWIVSRHLNVYAEVACDDRVVESFNCRAEYADDLLELSSDQKHSAFALSYLRGSELYERINRVLDPCRRKNRLNLWQLIGVTAVLMCSLSPIAMMKVEAVGKLTLWDDAYYPIPAQVPLLLVPTESPIANKASRIQWMLRQMAIDYPTYAVTTEKEQAEKLLAQVRREVKPRTTVNIPKVPEEQMVVFGEIENALDIDKAVVIERVNVDRSHVEVQGYIPIKVVSPKYPRKAIERNITGRVVVQFDVNTLGYIENPTIIVAEPSTIFNRAVLAALKEFRFMPLSIDGIPVTTKNVSETFVFILDAPLT